MKNIGKKNKQNKDNKDIKKNNSSIKIKVLFIDRDGTIISEPDDEKVDSFNKLKLIKDVIPILLELQKNNFRLVMISNQDGLGSDDLPKDNFYDVHNFLMEILNSQGVIFDEIFICPHWEKENCKCRKPKIGLIENYLKNNNIDFENSYVIGDRDTDIELAENIGVKSFKIGIKQSDYNWEKIRTEILYKNRTAIIERITKETSIIVKLNLEGQGKFKIDTKIGFLNHMLELLSKHSLIDLEIYCSGDLQVDEHHSIEDIALTLGEALKKALGEKRGINRYGFILPMDESQAKVLIDLGGRAYFTFKGSFSREKVGDLPTEMISHFFRSLSEALKCNLHIEVSGENNHHMIEAIFKSFAHTLKQAVKRETYFNEILSTKGIL